MAGETKNERNEETVLLFTRGLADVGGPEPLGGGGGVKESIVKRKAAKTTTMNGRREGATLCRVL